MAVPRQPRDPAPRARAVDARTLWSGGGATALVVALIALVGVLVFRGVFDIPLLAPQGEGVWGDVSTVRFMVAAAVAALLAVALVHLLLLSTPRALSFFGWIVGLATVVAGVAPFVTDAPLGSKLASALINVVIGFAILGLVSGIARTAVARAG
ncbi:DUF6069 family protein [Promicromonospora sp. NPDC052451]|uniref:DUF6069 family protein n=1 Tax=Promicromonospora sp. NPDC052451 TaxID=3364407 RepID=UPI0037CCB863